MDIGKDIEHANNIYIKIDPKSVSSDIIMKVHNVWVNKLMKIYGQNFWSKTDRVSRSGIIELAKFYSEWLKYHEIDEIDIKVKRELENENYHTSVCILRLLGCFG